MVNEMRQIVFSNSDAEGKSAGGIAIQILGPRMSARGPSLSQMSHSVSSQMTRHGNV
jgi:hypothetical protein